MGKGSNIVEKYPFQNIISLTNIALVRGNSVKLMLSYILAGICNGVNGGNNFIMTFFCIF